MRLMEVSDELTIQALSRPLRVATPRVIDFTNVIDVFSHRDPSRKNFEKERRYTSTGLILEPAHVRSRAKRRADKAKLGTEEEFDLLNPKPVEDWDLEELARGRPRNTLGTFAGRAPSYISRAVHEAAMDRFKHLVKMTMNAHTADALTVMGTLINSTEVDDRGKPIVPASTKLDAAKFLLEHIMGKPTQRIEQDISVKLQGVLANVMVNPTAGGYAPAHLPGVTMKLGEADGVVDEDLWSSSSD